MMLKINVARIISIKWYVRNNMYAMKFEHTDIQLLREKEKQNLICKIRSIKRYTDL